MICTARPAGRHESLLLCFCSSVQIKPVYICICVLVKQQTPTCVATQFLLCECEWGRDAAPLPPGLSVKVRVVPVWGGNPASVYKSVYTHTHEPHETVGIYLQLLMLRSLAESGPTASSCPHAVARGDAILCGTGNVSSLGFQFFGKAATLMLNIK